MNKLLRILCLIMILVAVWSIREANKIDAILEPIVYPITYAIQDYDFTPRLSVPYEVTISSQRFPLKLNANLGLYASSNQEIKMVPRTILPGKTVVLDSEPLQSGQLYRIDFASPDFYRLPDSKITLRPTREIMDQMGSSATKRFFLGLILGIVAVILGIRSLVWN